MGKQFFVSDAPLVALEGQSTRSPTEKVDPFTASAVVAPGRFVVRSSDGKVAHPGPTVAAPAALVASGVLFNAAGDDVVLSAKLNPPRNVTVTFAVSSQANIAATQYTITGFLRGLPVSEAFTATLNAAAASNHTGVQLFDEVTGVAAAAQDGDVTASIGVGTRAGPIEGLGFVQHSSHRIDSDYAVDEQVPVIKKGELYVRTEDACAEGGQVFVRTVLAGLELAGAVRATPDGTSVAPDAVRAEGWKFKESSTAGSVVVIERL